MENIIINVEGMACHKCEERIQNAISSMENVREIVANHENKTVTIIPSGKVDVESIKNKIETLGFEVVK